MRLHVYVRARALVVAGTIPVIIAVVLVRVFVMTVLMHIVLSITLIAAIAMWMTDIIVSIRPPLDLSPRPLPLRHDEKQRVVLSSRHLQDRKSALPHTDHDRLLLTHALTVQGVTAELPESIAAPPSTPTGGSHEKDVREPTRHLYHRCALRWVWMRGHQLGKAVR